MTSALSTDLQLASSQSLAWYRASSTAERGFCSTCGSNLLWRQFASDTTSITAGTLDAPTGLAIEQHIFVADKSDYHSLNDDLPKLQA
jgi:hypothetical protein